MDRRHDDLDGSARELRRFTGQYPHLASWVLSGLVGLTVLSGGIYIRTYETRLASAEKRLEEEAKANQDQKGKLGSIEERGKQNQEELKEIKGDVKEIQKDIKELLRQRRPP